MVVFICKEDVEGIWCGIYDAWMSRLGHANVRLEPDGRDRELFCEYRDVVVNPEKAAKVTDSIRTRLSEEIYEQVYKSALSQDELRCDKIYRFLILAFAHGPKIRDHIQALEVYQVFQMNRNLEREYNHMLGFTRFSQMREGILISRIRPKNDIIVMLAAHFADRMPNENWIIYDVSRQKASIHQAGAGWLMVRTDSDEWQSRLNRNTDEVVFENLWKTFHTSIAISERNNPRCQMNMLPLRFRPYMTEFVY